ncbi:MAG TPA: RNB domain-containing ribonuclease [Vicinamibacterales bacterium]|nr:RNB domain-containing ribonuclease [Vicinamibacterales bacterium]
MNNREQLRAIAVRAMRDHGLDPDFPQAALAEAAARNSAPQTSDEPTRDLRSLLWCSIDNDDSRDLDQLSVAERLSTGDVKVLVAIADVDAIVKQGSAIDGHAAQNTTSVYTPAIIFPMLPERLSTDLTSLADQQERVSVVTEFVVSPDGTTSGGTVYGARVKNYAKLAYRSVGAWLAGNGPLPAAAAAVHGMDDQLRMQDQVAQALNHVRHQHGALEFARDEVEHVFDGDTLRNIREEPSNRARDLIENLMIAANGVVARFLDTRGFPSLRRVVRTPERWDRIRGVAAEYGDTLPETADSEALAAFLARRQTAAPDAFAELSHRIIKLIGSGEYVVDPPGQEPPGHFGLAVRDYTHSTAPNRRYPDLITQRLLKATLAGRPSPYSIGELEKLAAHCTIQEDNANKVERQVRKSAAALVVQSSVGQTFDAVVTGASPKGTFVRVMRPPIEGMLVRGANGADVGDRVHVRLSHVDVERGFIDFERL